VWDESTQGFSPRGRGRNHDETTHARHQAGEGGTTVIKLKRVYESPASGDGVRVLVERLWPRGIRKATLDMDAWLKDAAPSAELRRWFNHDPAKWAEFRRRYRAELDAHPESWSPLLAKARHGQVTLLYSSHDLEHNNAVVLRDYLSDRLKTRRQRQVPRH
jgi:uncharacterized protein YeaO (DUF488 family)